MKCCHSTWHEMTLLSPGRGAKQLRQKARLAIQVDRGMSMDAQWVIFLSGVGICAAPSALVFYLILRSGVQNEAK
jgi:hypothetical protein